MKLAVPYIRETRTVAPSLNACAHYLLVTIENGMARETQVVPSPGVGSSAMLRFIGQNAIDALICGELGIASRNALEMLGVQLIPGCSGSAEEAVSRFLAGETQGDPTVLSLCREDDPDDPMNCMHDCSKCSGCGMSEIPEAVRKQIPEV